MCACVKGKGGLRKGKGCEDLENLNVQKDVKKKILAPTLFHQMLTCAHREEISARVILARKSSSVIKFRSSEN